MSIWAQFQPNKAVNGNRMFPAPRDILQYILTYYHAQQPKMETRALRPLKVPVAQIGRAPNYEFNELCRGMATVELFEEWLNSARDPGFPDFVLLPGLPFAERIALYLRFRETHQNFHIHMPDLKQLWIAHAGVPDRGETGLEQYLRRFMRKHHLKLQTAKGLAKKGTSEYFSSPIRRDKLVDIVTRFPKMTLDDILEKFTLPDGELVDDAQRANGRSPSKSALYRAMKTLGLSHQHAHFVDPRAQPVRDGAGDIIRVAHHGLEIRDSQIRKREITTQERYEFAAKQRDPNSFLSDPFKLLFMDETTLQMNMQQRRAWGADSVAPILPMQKGPTTNTVQLNLIIGASPRRFRDKILIFEMKVTKPTYMDSPVILANDQRFVNNELNADLAAPIASLRLPERKTDIHFTEAGLTPKRRSTLLRVLDYLGISRYGDDAYKNHMSDVQARRILIEVGLHGRVGLRIKPSLRTKTPGSERQTSADVANFLRNCVRQQWKGGQRIQDRVLVWDNSITHDAPQAAGAHKQSWFHANIGSLCGIQNVMFTPQYTPGKNPVEAAFSYIKRFVRSACPDTGIYTPELMIATVKRAMNKIDARMIRHWVRGCGYGKPNTNYNDPAIAARVYGDACDPTQNQRRVNRVECAVETLDEKGEAIAVSEPVMHHSAFRNRRRVPKWRFTDKPAALRAFAESKNPFPRQRLRDVNAGRVLVEQRIAQHVATLARVKEVAAMEAKGELVRRWAGPINRPPRALVQIVPPRLLGAFPGGKVPIRWSRHAAEYTDDPRDPPALPKPRS